MNRSANEVMVLATKAARGAGAPPAQADRFGAAALLHLVSGRDLAELDAALAALPGGPILSYPLDIMCIAEQATDGMAKGPLAGAQTGLAQSYVQSLPMHASLTEDGTLSIDLAKPAIRRNMTRVDLPDAVYARWSALAARLLVPESEASRLTGAGAGTSDND